MKPPVKSHMLGGSCKQPSGPPVCQPQPDTLPLGQGPCPDPEPQGTRCHCSRNKGSLWQTVPLHGATPMPEWCDPQARWLQGLNSRVSSQIYFKGPGWDGPRTLTCPW